MSPTIHLSVKDELDKMVIEMMKGGYISIKKADQILDIFRARYPELPTSVRSVLRRCNDVEPKILDSGTYYHLGLKSSLLRISGHWLRRIRFNELQLQLNYDGLSLFKSSNQQLWPILGRIVAPLVSSVFVVGIYGGEVKPSDFNDMSATLITELQELLTVGINVDKYHLHLTVKLVALCSHFRSATCSETEITHAMATASQAFLHDSRDKLHKRGWRSKERLASQALSDVTVSSLFALLRRLLYCWYITKLSHILTRYYTLKVIYLFIF
ncbi:unnamed protein product [Schistosoma curassoni]|nr:unnamed protein product [Schistosoma curassoni]